MELNKILQFRKDLYFEGAVQADWFYYPEKSFKVAENFVFHGNQYYGIDDVSVGSKKRIDTISLVESFLRKFTDERANPLSLAIADYGTGKSHLAVTLGHIMSGMNYMPETYKKIISNIEKIDLDAANRIKSMSEDRNFVMIINGMRDFNLHSEILKAAQKSLKLYGLSDDGLRKLNKALETAELFLNKNSKLFISLFEEVSSKYNWNEKGEYLIEKLKNSLLTDEIAFEIVNEVYHEVTGKNIQWDEGLSAQSVLETLISEYCGMNGKFDHIIILFDEFGRYLEYASGSTTAKSGDSALQQIFEVAQNAEGVLQVINFIQSDIKTYLQRIDQTKNISRYIGRYDASDKYYISSNLETVFANLIHRVDKESFNNFVIKWQKEHEQVYKDLFDNLNRWTSTKGIWKDYKLFRKVIVEGIYPMHPISTFMLTQLSDYLQNRSSLTLISNYIESFGGYDLSEKPLLILPEYLMSGDLYVEMLAAEQDGKQSSQHCIRYDNILRKFSDKLSEKSLMILRANLVLRILRFRTNCLDDVKKALQICSGLSLNEINSELEWLVTEYAVLGYDDHACCFDFMEESNGAHDFKIYKKRLLSTFEVDKSLITDVKILEIAKILEPVTTNFSITNKIATNEWVYKQELYPIEDFSNNKIEEYINEWNNATTSLLPKGKLVWLYINKDTNELLIENAKKLIAKTQNMPIIYMVLNDEGNRLLNCLKEYFVLESLDIEIRKKYERHFNDDYKQAEINLIEEFEELKKNRLNLSINGVNKLDTRMANYLSNVFSEIYPNVLSFNFDGFITKGNNIGGKGGTYFCTIIKMLLSGSVTYDVIHNFSSDIRNRIDALLMYSSISSWKCINDDYNVTPPIDKKAKYVYDQISSDITYNKSLECKNIFAKYTKPPYGLSEDVIILMLAVVCCNLNYCLKFNYNNEMISINNWKELVVVKDKKIDIDIIKKSTLIFVDAGAVNTKYVNFFKKIDSNKSIFEVVRLKKQLEAMVKEDEVPEELKGQYLIAQMTLDKFNKAKDEWDETNSKIELEFEDALEKKELYNALKSLELIRDFPIKKIFDDNGLIFDIDCENRFIDKKNEISTFIDGIIDEYVENMTCKSVETMKTFFNHNSKIAEKLKTLGFEEYSQMVIIKRDFIYENMEKILAVQILRKEFPSFMADSKVDWNTSYSKLSADFKKAKEYKEKIETLKKFLGKDYLSFIDNINLRMEEIKHAAQKIKLDISNIWDSLFEVKSMQEISEIITKIERVLQRGMKKEDQEALEETLRDLKILQSDLSMIKEINDSREELLNVKNSLLSKYEDSEFDFEVIDIINELIKNEEYILNQKSDLWKSKYLNIDNKSRQEILIWLKKVEIIPEYVETKVVEECNVLIEKAKQIISDGNIDDILYYFNNLKENEKLICFNKIKELINGNN